MRRMLALTVVGGLAALTGLCTPYQVRFEGDCLPESQPGWTRHYSSQYGGAQRWIETGENGAQYLVVDSLAHQGIYDFAEMDRPINPTEPGERFYCEWRMLVAEQYGARQGAVAIAPDQYGILGFGYTYGQIVGTTEGWSLPIDPGVFHTYRLESTDMIVYQLWIDGEHVRDGYWDLNSLNQSFVNFGDGTQGGGSRAMLKWDWFAFGVVPEPDPLLLFIFVGACGVHRPR